MRKMVKKMAVGGAIAAASLWVGAGSAAASGHAHWSYEGKEGPEHWAEVDKSFSACQLGHRQTPIDIVQARKAKLPPIAFAYRPTPAAVVDNGHTVQVKLQPGNRITVGDRSYDLLQFHFHKPSEEKVQGKAFAMDAHLVHQASDGKLAVVGVLLQPGAASATLEQILQAAPKGHGESAPGAITVDPAAFLPPNRAYYTFAGSLTTPPCTEGVTWFVLKHPTQVANEQVATFAKRYPHNARPVQPVGDRVIEVSE